MKFAPVGSIIQKGESDNEFINFEDKQCLKVGIVNTTGRKMFHVKQKIAGI
jgi:hypothetical protein